MSDKKKNKSESTDDRVLAYTTHPSGFNPFEELADSSDKKKKTYDDPVRVLIEKKGRGGKTVSIVQGLQVNPDHLEKISKELKSQCGTGGSAKKGEIIIQGDHRDKIIKILKSKGYNNVKKSGG